MVRDALGKVMWVGRATVFCVGLAVVLALVIGTASVALAAVPGDPFKLGQVNSINRLSTLVGNSAGPILRVQNKGTGPAADLRVQAGKPPMTVNSTGRVPRLNADMVDGKHASVFLPKNGKAVDSDKLDGKDSTEFYEAGSKVANSDKLDGLDSTDFVRPLWAHIYWDGTVVRSRGVLRDPLFTRRVNTGYYVVRFTTEVRDCAYAVTITRGFTGQTGTLAGGRSGSSKEVAVFTTNSAGTAVDYPFHLVVTC